MPLTLTVGDSATVALVQKQATVGIAGTPNIALLTLTLPAPTAAGSLLVGIFTSTILGPTIITSAPPGWVRVLSSTTGNPTEIEVWIFPASLASLQTFTFTTAVTPTSTHLSEWAGISRFNVVEVSGDATTTSGQTLTPTVTTPVAGINDLVIAAWLQGATTIAAATFTSPAGFTRLVDDGAISSNTHTDIEYQINPPVGQLAPILTSSLTTAGSPGARGVVVAFKRSPPLVDQTAYIKNDSQTIKLNTYDFGLLLGGRLLLENSTLDGYQLEDGSGVLLLDTLPPTVGDPVVLTTPAWTGRVVSTTRADIVDRKTNYALVTVAATNTTAAPGGTAPGDFSDVPAGGSLLLETGTDEYLQEDGVGEILLEGTSFAYRNLSVKVSQNQNGTTTTYGTLETFETGFQAGQTFLLTSANLGYTAQSFTITNVTITFIGVGTPVYLVEFGDAYQTMQKAGGGVLTQQLSQPAQQYGVVMSAGVLGYAQVVTDQAGITAAADLSNLVVTVNVMTGRRIRITAAAEFLSTIADDTAGLFINEGATVLGSFYRILRVATRTEGNSGTVILTPTAGVHTYKLQANRSGTGSVTMKADIGTSFAPAFILVEDIGT